ncbi:MAG: AAA family ATPase [Spirochaetia bacterium]|nr:AAA family ATPase [Spirochaetia bacterium]
MLKSYFGISENPFSLDKITLLPFQEEIFDILRVHSQQGGLCLLMGEPGTGKSVIKHAISQNADKRMMVVTVARTLHTYTATVKILCQAFNIDFVGDSFKCEKRLIDEVFSLNRQGKMLILVIDDAHLLDIQNLRKLRLLFEEFPKNYNVVLIGQSELLSHMTLNVNEDIRSRVTYSKIMPKLTQDDLKTFILGELDKVGLGHNTFTEEALALLARSADGVLRRARNLSLGTMLEAVRRGRKNIDIDLVNTVLIQPHWRIQKDMQPQPV